MRMRHAHSATLFAALALSGCTLITGDYKVDDTAFPRDLDFTFQAMSPHAGLPMDVAVVDGEGFAQSRARIYLPPKPSGGGTYPDVAISLERALWKGNYKLYFYIDDNGNYLLDTADDARMRVLEHPWIEDVPASGVGSFSHSTQFKIFDTASIRTLGGDVLLHAPALDGLSGNVRDCLLGLVRNAISDSIEVRVFLEEADGTRRQMGLLKTFAGVELPSEITIEGIVDDGSSYVVEVVRDGESQTQEFPEHTGNIELQVNDWLGLRPAAITACQKK